MRFGTKNQFFWRGEWKDKKGKIMMEIDGVVRRSEVKDEK